MNQSASIYQDMAARTGSSIYIGVVGPVRTGKSTFIKRFMETQVLPNIQDGYRRDRARDELPQSGSGRTIMTAEPKFVPEEAVEVRMEEGVTFSVRLIDCVGYMVPGAVGQYEDLSPRMVMTPWYDHEIPMTEAAELGTRKVICDHSTVGIVVTTDGSVTEIPREDYLEAEERVIRELQELGKPFVVLLNSAQPQGSRAQSMAADIERRYDVRCLPVNCLELGEQEITELLQGLLYEFPLRELDLFLPAWVEALPPDHPIKTGVYQAVRREAADLAHVRQLRDCLAALQGEGDISAASIRSLNLGIGIAEADLIGVSAGLSAGHRLRHCDAQRGGAEPGGPGDRPPGRPLQRPHEGQRPLHPHDPGGHCHHGLAHRGQRKAVRGHGELSAPGVRGRHRQALAVQHLRPQLPRDRGRRPAGKAPADAAGLPEEAAGGPGAHHQRRQRRPDLHHSVIFPGRDRFAAVPAAFYTEYIA